MVMFVKVLLRWSTSWWWPRLATRVASQWQRRLTTKVGSMLVLLLGWWVDDDESDNKKIRFVCFLKMMWGGHVLDHIPDHMLNHMIISLVTTALQSVILFRHYIINYFQNYYSIFAWFVTGLTSIITSRCKLLILGAGSGHWFGKVEL